MLEPDVPDFAGGHRNVGSTLHALDHLDEVADLLLVAEDRLVADDDALTLLWRLASSITERISRSLRSLFLSIHAPTVTRRPNSRRDARHEFDAAGRGIGADGAGQGASSLRSARICAARGKRAGVRMREPSNGA